MILVAGIVFICGLFFLSYIIYHNSKNIFHPILYILIFYFIRNIGYLISVIVDPFIVKENIQLRNMSLIELLCTYFSMTLLYYYLLYWGYISVTKNKTLRCKQRIERQEAKYLKFFLNICLILSFIGIGGYVLSMGSMYNLILNFVNRSEVLSDNKFLQISVIVTPLILYNSVYLFYIGAASKKKMILCSIYTVVSLLCFGSRTIALSPVIGGTFIYLYLNDGSMKYLYKYIYLAIVLFPLLIIISDLRNPDKVYLLMESPQEYIVSMFEDEEKTSNFMTKQLSGVYITLFIIEHYNHNNYWYGKSIYDLLLAPIPSSMYKDKPPVDEGRYVTTAYYGRNYSPPTSRERLEDSSLPPGSLGVGYMNFGILGTFFLAILRGITIGCLTLWFMRGKGLFIRLVILYICVQSFDYSVHHVFGFVTKILTILILYGSSRLLYRLIYR